MKFSFRIGPTIICLAADLSPLDPQNQFYSPFEIPTRNKLVDLNIRVHLDSPPLEKGLSKIAGNEGNWQLFSRSKGWRLEIFDSLTHLRVQQVALISERFDEMGVYFCPPSTGWRLGAIMQPLVQWWLTGWLAFQNLGMIMHGCAVTQEEVGLAFFGPSGTGKTTLAKLCLEQHEGGWTVLNDERIVIWETEDGWRVGGTPWPGMLGKTSPTVVPLAGIFTLRKSSENRIVSLSPAEFLMEMISEAFHPIWSQEATEGLLSAAARLTERLPTGEFHFLKDSSAVEFLKGYLPRPYTPSLSISQ